MFYNEWAIIDINDEFRGLEYFAQRKVLFDYRKAVVVIADQGDEVDPVHPVAEFPISGLPQRIVFSAVIDGVSRKLIFDMGASIANYLTESIAKTGTPCGTVEDFHPQKGKYTVNLFSLPVKVGGETVNIVVHPMAFKRCVANPEHVYVELHDACPICGCKEYTRA